MSHRNSKNKFSLFDKVIIFTFVIGLFVTVACAKVQKEENVPAGVERVEKTTENTVMSSVCNNCGEKLSCRDVEKAIKFNGANSGVIVCVQHKGDFSCVYVPNGVCR